MWDTRAIPAVLLQEKSKGWVGMTARSSGAKRRIVVRRKKTGSTYTPPKLPAKPKVTVGAKSYGRSKSGGYIVTRFYLTQIWLKDFTKVKPDDPWFVIDLEEASLAAGTKQTGYPDKEKAIKVARRYRDEYGAWTVMPF